MVRRGLIVLLVLVLALGGLALVADGYLRSRVEDRVARQVQTAEGLDAPPEVDIGDTLFLLAAWRGRFDRVTVTAASATTDGVRLREVEARLTGVHVPVRQILDGADPAVRADRFEVRALMPYPVVTDLLQGQLDRATGGDGAAAADLTLAAGPDTAGGRSTLQVSGTVSVAGVAISLALPVRVELRSGTLVLEAIPDPGDPTGERTAALVSAAAPLPPLPYGLEVSEVSPEADGLRLTATGTDVVLDQAGAG